MATVLPTWAVAFLQKCCYKWRPRKCLGLVVANLIILFQNWRNKSMKITKVSCFFFFIFWETNRQAANSPGEKKNIAPHHANFETNYYYFLKILIVQKKISNNKTLWRKIIESSKILKNIKMKILKINNYSTDTSCQGSGGIINFSFTLFWCVYCVGCTYKEETIPSRQ